MVTLDINLVYGVEGTVESGGAMVDLVISEVVEDLLGFTFSLHNLHILFT